MKHFKSLTNGLNLSSFSPKKGDYQDSLSYVESIKKCLDNIKDAGRNDLDNLQENQLLIQVTGRFVANSLKNLINVEKEDRKAIQNRCNNVLGNIENIVSLPRGDPHRTKQIDSLKVSLGLMFSSEEVENLPREELFKLREEIRTLLRASDTDILYQDNNAPENAKRFFSEVSDISNVLSKTPIVMELQVSFVILISEIIYLLFI